MRRVFGQEIIIVCVVLCMTMMVGMSDACTTFGWVRSTGDWASDSYGGAAWNGAEPHGLMVLDTSSCLYWSDPVSNLRSGKAYQWKVTTQNTWDVNYGCPGIYGPNCQFTAGVTGIVRFVFDPQSLSLSVYQVPPASTPSPTSPPSPTSRPTSSPTTPSPATPRPTSSPTAAPQAPGTGVKQVFAHFMIGNTYWYDQNHFQNDMSQAKAVGVDAFALNIGTDDWTWNRVGLAYNAAQNVGFKCFLSFDMSIVNDANFIINGVVTVNGYAASYKYNNKLLVSTFGGSDRAMGYSSVNAAWAAIKSSLASRGISIFLVPNFAVDASTIFNNFPSIDGALSWGAWPNPTDSASALTGADNVYMNSANNAGKVYLAPWSPWFYTHLSYKNYLYHSDSLWYDRWQQLLAVKPHMIEIITWNDWGESSYIGTIDTDSRDLPASSPAYVYGFPHTAWLDTLPYFISYYKNGVAPSVTQDVVVYWYRPSLKSSVASADPYGQPYVANQDTSRSSYTPSQVLADKIYIITILKSAGTIQVTSGGSTVTQNVPAGANLYSTQLNGGQQTVTLSRNNAQVCTSTGAVQVSTNPSTYVYNAYVSGCKA